ncbi:MAG: purine-nucleoside phosphorylase, partial [Bacteroidetes bacterium]
MTYEQAQEAARYISRQWAHQPLAGIILGTGLGVLADAVEVEATIPYADIPHFPVSTAPSHKGRLLCGRLGGVPVLVMQGRFHYYEGYSLAEVTFPVRVMKLLGASILVASNACGSVHPEHEIGDIVVLRDHINLLPDNP